MQKISKKGSILIWSIMISLILSITFISISNKINLNLKQNISISENSEKKLKINENIKKIENIFKEIKDMKNKYQIEEKIREIKNLQNISDNLKIILNYKNDFFLDNENLEIIVLPNSNMNIKTYNDDEIFILENWKEEKIKNEKNINNWDNLKIFTLKTWWNSKISIISNNYIVYPEIYYEIIENFWNKKIVKQTWYLKIK